MWNGVSTTDTPVVFHAAHESSEQTWPAADQQHSRRTPDAADYEMIGPQVFRFEYYYLLHRTELFRSRRGRRRVSDHAGVAAIIVDIAVIDPKSKVLLTDAQITSLARHTWLTTAAA